MKIKQWDVSVLGNRPVLQKKDVKFYTTDTDAYLKIKLTDRQLSPQAATVTLFNKDDKSLVSESVDVVDNEINYHMRGEVIEHGGNWQGQVIFEYEGKDYTSSAIGFSVGGHLLDNSTPRLEIIENWNTFTQSARDFLRDLEGDHDVWLERIENLEEIYAPKLTEVTAQLAQTEQQLNEPQHYKVGKNQKYKTITEAYNQWVADGKKPSVIFIYAGTYKDVINAGSNVNLTFIGESKHTTIWKSTTGFYKHSPFTGQGGSDGGLHFKNLTLLANHDDTPNYIFKNTGNGDTGGGSYALHIDDPYSVGKTTVEDCILTSYQNSALGSGTRTNQEIVLKNVELYHYAEKYADVGGENTGANNGALLYHTAAETGHTGQRFKMYNVYAWSKNGPAIQMLSSSAGNTTVEIEIVNCIARSVVYDSLNSPQTVVFHNTNGMMVLTRNSMGNSSDRINYIPSQIAKLTEDNGLCKTVTDFNVAQFGFFMGNGATGVLNTPTSTWYIGMAISFNDKYIMQEAWAILEGYKKYRRYNHNGSWSQWVLVNELGHAVSASNRPTGVNAGYTCYDASVGSMIYHAGSNVWRRVKDDTVI